MKASTGSIGSIPSIGELWRIRGQHTSDLTYGSQFEASEGQRIGITEETSQSLVIEFIAYNSNFPGFGPSWVKKLDLAFKNCLVKTLGTVDAYYLEYHPQLRMPHVMAETLLAGWKRCSLEWQILSFLEAKFIPKELLKKLILFWGNHVIDTISNDPYRLIAIMRTSSAKKTWHQIDKIAQEQFGVSLQDPRRAIAAIESYLYGEYDNLGNTCASVLELQDFLTQQDINHNVRDLVHQYGQALLVIHERHNSVQIIGHYALEKFISDRLNKMVSSQSLLKDTKNQFTSLSELRLETGFKQRKELDNFLLSPEQIHAVQFATKSKLSLIAGCIGSGKTTVIAAIVVHHQFRNGNVWLVASTGKAAQQLAKQTNYHAESLFSFIHKIDNRKRNGLMDGAIVIIDNAQTLDISTTYLLLKWLPKTSQLCLVGDIKQLPPPGPGLVFERLYKHKSLVYELSKLSKLNETSCISTFCDAVNDQNLTLALSILCPFSKELKNQVCYFETAELDQDILCNLAANLWYEVTKQRGEDVQILSCSEDICRKLNTVIQKAHINKNAPSRVMHHCKFSKGDSVIFLRNDSTLMIAHGSLGIVKEIYEKYSIIDGRTCVVTIDFANEGERHLTLDDCQFLDLAYCLPVHISQANQYMHTIVIIDNPCFIDNSWLYTASSRSIKSLLFVGKLEVLKLAISSQPKIYQRNIGYPIEIEDNVE